MSARLRATSRVATFAMRLAAPALLLSACAHARHTLGTSSREDIYVLRSIRERLTTTTDACAASRTGFAPMPTDAERAYSFWSVRTGLHDGRIVNTRHKRVAELRGCFGATADAPRQNFHADIRLGDLRFRGLGECVAARTDYPERGLFSVRCQLDLRDLPAPFVGGLLTTNTVTSREPLGGETDPPGYTQASIATIRLWRSR